MAKQENHLSYRTLFIIGLIVLIVVPLAWSWAKSFFVPKLVVSDIDIGNCVPGQAVERTIVIKNEGRRPLLIHEAKTCCGVSLPYGFPKKIPARSTDVIVLRLRTPDGLVTIEKDITLHTNDPGEPVKKVFVRGTHSAPLYALPSLLNMKVIVAGKTLDKAVTFMIADNKQAHWSVVTSSPNLHTSEPRRIPAKRIGNKDYELFVMDVGVDKDASRGPLQEYIYVKTGIAGRRYFVIPVEATVERGLRVQPQQAFFGVVKGASKVNRIIRLEVIGPGWDSFKVNSSECPFIKTNVERKGEKKFELHISLDPTHMPKKLKSALTLESASGDSLHIPVLALRKNAPSDA